MGNLKLEVFSPGAEMEMAKREHIAQKVAEAYREGHAKGFAQGSEASAREHAEAQDQLRIQFVEALRDAQMSYAEAQTAVVASLIPVVRALTEGLAPSLAEAGLITELERQLKNVLEARPDLVPRISCAPELAAGIKAALPHFSERYTVDQDPRLTPLEARLAWDDGFDEIDIEACLSEMRKAVAQAEAVALCPPFAEEETANVG